MVVTWIAVGNGRTGRSHLSSALVWLNAALGPMLVSKARSIRPGSGGVDSQRRPSMMRKQGDTPYGAPHPQPTS